MHRQVQSTAESGDDDTIIIIHHVSCQSPHHPSSRLHTKYLIFISNAVYTLNFILKILYIYMYILAMRRWCVLLAYHAVTSVVNVITYVQKA